MSAETVALQATPNALSVTPLSDFALVDSTHQLLVYTTASDTQVGSYNVIVLIIQHNLLGKAPLPVPDSNAVGQSQCFILTLIENPPSPFLYVQQ